MANSFLYVNVWLQRPRIEEAESAYHTSLVKLQTCQQAEGGLEKSEGNADTSPLVNEILQARQQIQKVLNTGGKAELTTTLGSTSPSDAEVLKRLQALELENDDLKKTQDDVKHLLKKLESRIAILEACVSAAPIQNAINVSKPLLNAVKNNEEDGDIDLFDDDEKETDKVAAHLRGGRLRQCAEEAKKNPVITKLLVDVKPLDDKTDMEKMEQLVRSITMDGLQWKASKQILAPGTKNLVIDCIVEEKISIDDLKEKIKEFTDYVQSTDIVLF